MTPHSLSTQLKRAEFRVDNTCIQIRTTLNLLTKYIIPLLCKVRTNSRQNGRQVDSQFACLLLGQLSLLPKPLIFFPPRIHALQFVIYHTKVAKIAKNPWIAICGSGICGFLFYSEKYQFGIYIVLSMQILLVT